MAQKPQDKIASLKGEILDLDCYLTHGLRDVKHDACSESCLKDGAPLGLLTEDDQVYLLLPDRAAPGPYESLKTRVGDRLVVSGPAHRRGNMRGLVVRTQGEGPSGSTG